MTTPTPGSSLLVNLPLVGVSTTPFFVMPPALLALGAFLRRHGEPVGLLDLCVSRPWETRPADPGGAALETFQARLSAAKPALVGVSVMAAGQFSTARAVCRCAKDRFPDVVTVAGGAHVSQFPREILSNCPEIDFIVIGEGEEQLLALARSARAGSPPQAWPGGLARRMPGGGIELTRGHSSFQDVDALPRPAYDLVRFEDYLHDTSTWHNPFRVDFGVRVPVISSRGCPNGCNFCSVAAFMGLRYRPRRAESVADELQMLAERFGVRCVVFFDANFAQDASRVVALCDELQKRNLRMSLDLPTGLPVNAAAPEMIDALAAAGLIRTCISVESGDAHIRNDVMGKNIGEDEIFRVVSAIRRHPQVFLLTDFVLGMPEDTRESLEASCRLIEKLETDDIALSIATPYPGTRLYRQCERDGLFFPGVDRGRLWEADWYTHANVQRFIIRPYALDEAALASYRDRILALRDRKRERYRDRMQERFGVEVRPFREGIWKT